MGRWTRRGRIALSTVLTVVAVLFLLVGGLTLYLRQEIFDAGAFADHAQDALKDDTVRQVASDELVEQIIRQGSAELLQAKPLLQTVVNGAFDTAPFQRLFRGAALNLHRAAFTRDDRSVALDLADAGQVAISAARSIAPSLAAKIPKDATARLIDFRNRKWAVTLLEIADQVRFLGIVLPLAALLLIAAAIAVAPVRRSAIARVGLATTVVAILGFVALLLLRNGIKIRLEGVDDATATDAGKNLFDEFFGGLGDWCLAVGAGGLVLAAAATSILQPMEVASRAERLRALVLRPPATPAARLLRGAAIFLVSLFVVLEPSSFLEIVAVVLGAYGLWFATSEILMVVTKPRPAREPRAGPPTRRVALVAAAVVVLAAGAGVAVALALTGTPEKRPLLGADQNPTYCNGFRELCDRNLDSVVFAASHNSMSAGAYRGFFFAHNTGTIGEQLKYGVRGLLIDAYDGVYDPKSKRVRTDLDGPAREKVAKALDDNAIAAAERLAGRVGLGNLKGKHDIYLCHALCELGAVRIVDALDEVRDFMVAHPDEVIVIFIEDYVPATSIARVFREAGLIRYALVHPRDAPWPTLRQMITSGKRLLVLAENRPDEAKVPWYENGFDVTQDTPYSFKTVDQVRDPHLSCRLNRGNVNSPLFLINHWIERVNPSPGQTKEINSYDFLMRRVQQCERLRRLAPPTLVAVNFYDEGDVLGVVNVLNRLPRDAKAKLPTRRGFD